MNIEISLLLAHLCLIPDMVGDEFMCRLIGICLHFFWTVCFAFFMLESMFMYSILANVVRKLAIQLDKISFNQAPQWLFGLKKNSFHY